jgi:hypothetical protein
MTSLSEKGTLTIKPAPYWAVSFSRALTEGTAKERTKIDKIVATRVQIAGLQRV